MSDKEKYERLQEEVDNHHKAMKQCLGILADTLKVNKEQIKFLEEKSLSRYNGLQLAIEQLEDAKQMLIECGKTDWADTLDTSIDYYIARGKLMAEETDNHCYNKEYDYKQTIFEKNQDKISFAVAELNKLWDCLYKTDDKGYVIRFASMNDRDKFNEVFNNQIKQLKEMKYYE